MAYALESKKESQRLTKQNETPAYDYRRETDYFSFPNSSNVLDLGCGNGEVTNFLSKKFPQSKFTGVDASIDRIKEAWKYSGPFRFLKSDIENLKNTLNGKKFDFIFTRFCLQHLPDPKKALQDCYFILKEDGKMIVIETDRLMIGLIHSNEELAEMLDKFKEEIPCNLNMASELPAIVKDAGFEIISERREIFKFESELEKEAEYTNNARRLDQCFNSLVTIFGSEDRAHRFRNLYLEEMASPKNSYFIAKHIFELSKIPRGTKES